MPGRVALGASTLETSFEVNNTMSSVETKVKHLGVFILEGVAMFLGMLVLTMLAMVMLTACTSLLFRLCID